MCFYFCVQHNAQAEVVQLASTAIGQCSTWGAQEHRGTYERILAATMTRSRELRQGGRDSSPSAQPSVVLELRLDSGFAADEVGASQWMQPRPILTQPSQLVADGATTGSGATPAGSGAPPTGGGATPVGRSTPDAPGSSQAATPSPDQLGPRVVRVPDPWTYDRDQTWAGARAVRGKRGRRI
jgi:hypothetical protein